MTRTYNLVCALDALLCLFDECDLTYKRNSKKKEIANLRELYRKIPVPIHVTDPNKFIEAVILYYDYYYEIERKSYMRNTDRLVINYFMNKLLVKITEIQMLLYQDYFRF